MAFRNRESFGDDLEETHEINVTPFIDVMLVLLIIAKAGQANISYGQARSHARDRKRNRSERGLYRGAGPGNRC